jgi:hypothetical protein
LHLSSPVFFRVVPSLEFCVVFRSLFIILLLVIVHCLFIFDLQFWLPFWYLQFFFKNINNGNNKITELRTILQRESQNS